MRGLGLRFLPVTLLVAAAGGVLVLYPELTGVWLLAIVVPLLAVALLRCFSWWPRWLQVVGIAVGALTIPVFALLGVDWAWAQVTSSWRPPPLASLVGGAVIVGVAAWIYLRPWWVREPAKRALRWALLVVLLLIVLPPAGFWLAGLFKGDEQSLAKRGTAVSWLHVVVVRDGGDAIDPEPAHEQGWRVRTWAGVATGRRIDWGPEGAPPAVPDEHADHILLLMAGGDAKPRRWLELADEAAPVATPTFALLRTSDELRIAPWRKALARSRGPGVRRGGVLSAGDPEAAGSTTDLALRLAVLAPAADQDLALAAKHRPALFFDSDEPYPVPLNVDRLLASGKIRLCDSGQALRTLCSRVNGSEDLHNGASHLAFDPEELAEIRDGSTVYVRVTRSGNDHPNSIYLDYWWYFPNNPTGAAGGALCGAGFVIAGITCFDHESDWEGVTVVLDADDPSGAPSAVSYAQHDGVTRYTWPALQKLWDDGYRERFGKGVDLGAQPLVFVARGTHASYPTSCSSERCVAGGVPGVPAGRPLKEQSHDGGRPWPGEAEEDCAAACVTALPTRRRGRERARWNAFEGRWGTANCVLALFCSSSNPPRAPGEQGRYRHPWCAKAIYSLAGGTFRRSTRPCRGREPSAAEVEAGERLLALGDSFSSGQGAGSYDEDTNDRGNTCFRSPDAWPQVVADELDLVALPSLACSGAVIAEVMESRKRAERERSISQLSRISGDPAVVTITIGGNDAGFADVLAACVIPGSNCRAKYDKPGGDLLQLEVERLARSLPGVYRAIRDAAPPGARVVVVGYPRLFPDKEDIGTVGNCAAADEIKPDEVIYINDSLRAMNAAIAGAADAAGVEFVDVTEAFDGHELRCTGKTYMNHLRLRPEVFPASFHPNAEGHARLGEVVARALAAPLR